MSDNISPLILKKLVRDVRREWWRGIMEEIPEHGSKLTCSAKVRLVEKWSDESRIPVYIIEEVSDLLIDCCLLLAGLSIKGNIEPGPLKIYYKLKFRKMPNDYLRAMHHKTKKKLASPAF